VLKVLFFGNSQSIFSNTYFQALIQTSVTLVGLVDVPPSKRTSTNPVSFDYPSFAEVARVRNLPVFEPDSPNLPEFMEATRELAPDLMMAVGYLFLLKPEILQVPKILAVNFHASLLPAYRGKHPVFWALRYGERWSGLTVHVMDPNFDTGDILYQVRLRTRKDDTVTSLYNRIMKKSVTLVPRLINDVEQGTQHPVPQPKLGASYYSSVREDDFRLDWLREAEHLRRWIQTTPGHCFYDIADQRIFFTDARVTIREDGVAPGTLLKIGRAGCIIATGKDALYLRRARSAEGNEQAMPKLCRQLGLKTGDLLA
jgi:methionyl-tRNA formyltransferase